MDFQGRVALVTGASIGLGRRFALDLAAAGATVVGVARTQEPLDALAKELPDGSWTCPLDVSDEQGVRALVEEIAARHGRLDILINNAGIEERRGALEMDPAFVRSIMRVNFDGTVNCTMASLPHMLARGEGWIVSMISGAGRAPVPHEAAYSASKAAITAFSESISYELEPKGVRVKVLSPGFVASTRMAQSAVQQGFTIPPRFVHRTEEQVSRALMRAIDRPGFEINLARAETFAPVARALMPRLYRRGIAKSQR